MRGYVNVPPCTYTHRNWGWWDTNGDGRVDNTMAWDADSQSLYELWELFHNGYMIHTNTTWGMVATQRWTSWSVMGVRSRGNSSYGMAVYADNNRNDFLEVDYVSPGVRFVVGDYNHNRLGNDFIRLYNFGGNGQYVLSYEAGSQVLYPDGVDRAQSWSSTNVVKAFDMPLLGGETIQIQLDIDTAGLDLGMALFKSNGDVYYGSRQDAVWEEDDWPAGISESYTFDVPEDDVYGLIVWSNNEAAGSFSIKIGPTLRSLDEATPFLSYLDLSLYSYSPYTNYWAVAAARPGASSNVTLRLFGDSHFEDELATSGAYPNIELIAADYNPGYSTDYLRTIRKSGVNPHQTEWEQGSDILAGFEDHTWENGHICKVWDAHLQAGQEYRFQRYGSVFAPLTTRIFLFSSADGDRYKQRSGAAAGAAAATPEGEWFTYTAPADDWYGFVMMNEDDSSGGYSVGVGPYVVLDEEESASFTDQVIWADFDTQAGSWNVVGVRPEEGGSSAMWLWDCEDRFSPCYLDGDAYGDLVRYVVLDGNHLPADTYYARADRLAGTGVQTVSFDSAPAAALSLPDPDAIVIGQGTFSDGEVARIHDFALGFTPASVVVTVTPGSTALDVGVALFRSRSGQYIQGSDQAVAEANDGGPGIPEQMTASLTVRDTYGLVVTNRSGVAGEYEIRIQHLDAADVEQEAAPDRLDLQALGTATGHPTLRLALPETGP
ncbi:MAG: hypothetical protein R3E12_03050, partial [Candidatus Eisenbacteria bacterium]